MHICSALHDLVPFVQFKKREKHPWRSVTFSKVAGLKPATLLKLTLLNRCFPRFLNCTNGTKSHNAPHMISFEGFFRNKCFFMSKREKQVARYGKESEKSKRITKHKTDLFRHSMQGIKFRLNDRFVYTSFTQCLLCTKDYSFP